MQSDSRRTSFLYNAYAVILCLLLIISGFLATPSMFHSVNYEYRTLVPPLQLKLADLNNQIVDLRKSAREISAQGQEFDLNLRLRPESSYLDRGGKIGSVSSAGSSDASYAEADFPSVAPTTNNSVERNKSETEKEAARQERIRIEQEKRQKINSIQRKFYDVDRSISGAYDDIDAINRKIISYSTESNNAYLVARAIALGALGAIVARLSRASTDHGWQNEIFGGARNLTITALLGSIISVVAVGLFYTKQISIFHNQDLTIAVPDYWRTTILCLISGAFSDRLFRAAAGKVDDYVGRGRPATDIAPQRQQH